MLVDCSTHLIPSRHPSMPSYLHAFNRSQNSYGARHEGRERQSTTLGTGIISQPEERDWHTLGIPKENLPGHKINKVREACLTARSFALEDLRIFLRHLHLPAMDTQNNFGIRNILSDRTLSKTIESTKWAWRTECW
jgi:hypothetical protein